MHVAEVFLPLKVCVEVAPHSVLTAAVAQTVRACVAALGAKPYQARREAADTLRVLAASVAASGPGDDAKRALAVQRNAVMSALQVMTVGCCATCAALAPSRKWTLRARRQISRCFTTMLFAAYSQSGQVRKLFAMACGSMFRCHYAANSPGIYCCPRGAGMTRYSTCVRPRCAL